ncbi:MAG: MBL fold metallo-hydrolase [Deltaproteobacteria bacterium]|nr:MBL fold metallo-hydrolase [Deltaproteobacteria bacterium]
MLHGNRKTQASPISITVTYNNVPFKKQLRAAWGFSCLIEGTAQTILFDTGGNGQLLLENMTLLNKDPMEVKMVFLSHIHGDHTGGLEMFLRQNSDITVCLPESFPGSYKQKILRYGANIKVIKDPTLLMKQAYSSGEMGRWIKEQALILRTTKGLVIITGCSHPGIVNIVRKAHEHFVDTVYLVMGGFHLSGMSYEKIMKILEALKKLGVKKVAPSHCTGNKAISLFRQAWRDRFLEGGLGAIIRISQ